MAFSAATETVMGKSAKKSLHAAVPNPHHIGPLLTLLQDPKPSRL